MKSRIALLILALACALSAGIAFYQFVPIAGVTLSADGQSRLFVNTATPHQLVCLNSDGSNCLTAVSGVQTIASGAVALNTVAIPSGTCNITTASAPGVLSTDNILADFNQNTDAVNGYIPSVGGMLTIKKYPTAGAVNFSVCDNSPATIAPGPITLNWRVLR